MKSKRHSSPHEQLMAFAKKSKMPEGFYSNNFNTDDVSKDLIIVSSNKEESDLPLFPLTVGFKKAITETINAQTEFGLSGSSLIVKKPMIVKDRTLLSFQSIRIEGQGSITFEDGGSITASSLSVDESAGFSIINVGKNGADGIAGSNGIEGKAGGLGQSGSPGGAGQNGGSGEKGGDAASINILVETLNGHIILRTKGGKGGNGGQGGVGGEGGEMGPIRPRQGTHGGNGGNGGAGGDGGDGGDAGNIEVSYVKGSPSFTASIVPGSGGSSGIGGNGGAGGKSVLGNVGKQGLNGKLGSDGSQGKIGTLNILT